jgi:hypothetical protein
MPSSGMLCHVALIRTDVSKERIASIMRVTRISEIGTLAVTSNRRTLRRNTSNVTQKKIMYALAVEKYVSLLCMDLKCYVHTYIHTVILMCLYCCSFGKSYLTNMALTVPAHTQEPQTFSWSESMYITMKLLVRI